MQLGAVVRLDRGFPLVATADDTFRAEHAVGFAKSRGGDEVLLPAVGDRVAVRRAPGHDMGVIECVLPRRTSFERWRGRARGERQVLCSNVDSVLIVQALGAGEVLLDRVARSLVLALDCDAEPVVVLTKADRCDAEELERDLDRVRRLVGPNVRVIVTSSAEGRGLDEVRACVPAGSCAMILASRVPASRRCSMHCWATIRWRPAVCANATTRPSHYRRARDGGAAGRRRRDRRCPGSAQFAARGSRAGSGARLPRDCRGIARVSVWRLHAHP